MILIACVDDKGGVMFNRRRQSMDSVLRAKVLEMCAGRKLWMNHYSAQQFDGERVPEINIDESFISEAQAGEYAFVEGTSPQPYEAWIERVVLFKWNRTYPADTFFDLPLVEHGWRLKSTEYFIGNSHERITMEVYEK